MFCIWWQHLPRLHLTWASLESTHKSSISNRENEVKEWLQSCFQGRGVLLYLKYNRKHIVLVYLKGDIVTVAPMRHVRALQWWTFGDGDPQCEILSCTAAPNILNILLCDFKKHACIQQLLQSSLNYDGQLGWVCAKCHLIIGGHHYEAGHDFTN